ncbi:hypothetical protein ACM55F_17195 [Flavobacterium sp. XS2P12]|uniref:hypothetical protein n=1 Tax=Flavobacterium melibiosi TaxID=3398734 RepID=UPI003A8AA9DD
MEIKTRQDIGLLTTVNNFALYKQTVTSFPEQFKTFVIDGSEGLYGLNSFKFMFKKLKNQKLKWLVLVDEDVVFVNPDAVLNIIKSLENNHEDICGIRGGGVLSWRDKNPHLLNPFFCIFNLEKIYTIYNEKEFLSHQYIIPDEFDDDLSALPFKFNKESLFEEYYCFFLWLRRNNFKFKFLNAQGNDFENDLETTKVFDSNNKILLYHTWYARSYGNNKYHTVRIDRVINEGKFIKTYSNRTIIWYKNYRFSILKGIKKIYKPIIKFIK